MYNVLSDKAEEFISNEEIISSIEFAKNNSNNDMLIQSILVKAEDMLGITHREAMVLLESDSPDVKARIFDLARRIKEKFYGNRIVMFAPLYLSNYCVNGCKYCPYHAKNNTIARKKLTQDEIKREVVALADMGHKRLALETGEDPINAPIEYVIESIKTIYSIKHKSGAIRRVNVNIAATTIENYAKLKEAGIGTYILFQETYNLESYRDMHPTGPKADYAYHTEAMDRAMMGGVDDVGCGVLFGLNLYRYDFVGLLMHAEHLEAKFGVGPHTLSVPRIRPADDVKVDEYSNAIGDDDFEKLVALLRIAAPYTGIIVSTRESAKLREKLIKIGVSQLSGGSRTSVGGYADNGEAEDSRQFEVDDARSLDEIVNWLLSVEYVPSFCTACYREGRTGDRFMRMVKSGAIANICQANSIMTLKEYLEDYASGDTKEKGLAVINRECCRIPSEKVRDIVKERLEKMDKENARDFRF